MPVATPQAERSTPPPSDRSSLRLSEVARHVVIPEGIVETLWPDVAAVCEELGDEFDPWQHGLGQVSLGLREDGSFAATVGGVVLSIPRQVAKTFLVVRIVFALCCLFPNLTAIWTAHRVSTANSAFRSAVGLASRPGASRYVEKILTGDELTIIFKNGATWRFGARAQNFGRGETQIDVEVFDEAQILRADTLEDMIPAANQAKIPHGALLFFMGTPPRPKDEGEEFTARRTDALALITEGSVVAVGGDMAYVECSADPTTGEPDGPDLMDQAQIEKANPSYPKRTPWISILRMRKNLKDDDSWRREALGIWDRDGVKSWQAISRRQWEALEIPASQVPESGTTALAVKFSTDGERVGAAIAVQPADGPTHVEALGVSPLADGTASLVSWIAERWRQADRIVLDGKAGAGDLANELAQAGVPRRRIHIATTDEAITAHSGMLRAINEHEMTHANQPGLNKAAKVAGKRKIGVQGGWGWQAVTPDGDVTALDAATLARHFVTTGKRRARAKGRVLT